MCRAGEGLSPPTGTSPAEMEQDNDLPPSSSSHSVNKCPFCGLFSATFFSFLCLLLVISLSVTSKHSAEVLSSVPKQEKACDVRYGKKYVRQPSFVQA